MDSTIKLVQEIATKMKNFPCFQITVKQDAVGAYIWALLYDAYVKFVMCMGDMWVVEMCEVVRVELYWKLIAKMMGVVCALVARFLHGVVFIGCW